MTEKIFLTYTNTAVAPYLNVPLGHHIVLNYIDTGGLHHTLEAAPENQLQNTLGKLGGLIQEEVLSDGVHNTDSPFGRLKAKPENKNSEVTLNQPHTMIAEGGDLSPQWGLMGDFADEVNSTGYEYRPVSQNSNSFAGGALQRARLYGAGSPFPERFDSLPAFDPTTGQTTSRYVPGFEAPLRNPIDTEMPLPFPLDVRTGAPSDGFSVPERRGSLDDDPSKWNFVVPPGSSNGETARYLGRRAYPISPADTAKAVISPIADGPLTLTDAYLQYRKRLDANQFQ